MASFVWKTRHDCEQCDPTPFLYICFDYIVLILFVDAEQSGVGNAASGDATARLSGAFVGADQWMLQRDMLASLHVVAKPRLSDKSVNQA